MILMEIFEILSKTTPFYPASIVNQSDMPTSIEIILLTYKKRVGTSQNLVFAHFYIESPMILAEIIVIVYTIYTILSGLHRQLIGYANLHQTDPFPYKKRVAMSQNRVFAYFKSNSP